MKRTSLSILDGLVPYVHTSWLRVANATGLRCKPDMTQQLMQLTYHTFLIYTDFPDKYALHTFIYAESAHVCVTDS